MGLGDKHYPTPKKSQILSTVSFLESHKPHPFFKADVFRHFQVNIRRGWDILHQGRERRYLEPETRGRKHIISAEDLTKMEQIIWQFGFQARALTWQGLAIKVGIHASARTVQRAIGTLRYRKCIACEKGFVSPSNAKRRLEAAKLALHYRPHPEDWHDIRFSNKYHFRLFSEGKIQIIRKPGERYCPDCIYQSELEPAPGTEIRRYHV